MFAILQEAVKKPYTIGVTGGSGSGKTTFLGGLSARFTKEQLCLVSQDNYYRSRDTQPLDANKVKNFDLPESIDRTALHDDIRQLKSGKEVVKKEYVFNNPAREPGTLIFRPTPILIVEGLFVQYFEEIASELDLKIFIEARDHLKLGRRIRRDQVERGYDLDDVLYRYEHHVMPVYDTLIRPLKYQSDLIVPNDHGFDRAIEVLSGYLRTLL